MGTLFIDEFQEPSSKTTGSQAYVILIVKTPHLELLNRLLGPIFDVPPMLLQKQDDSC